MVSQLPPHCDLEQIYRVVCFGLFVYFVLAVFFMKKGEFGGT